jgi:hypothetical protein
VTDRERERHWVVDSIEEHVASIELDDGTMIMIPQSQLPANVKQGDVLRVTIALDSAATQAAYDRSAAQLRSRKGTGDPGGDIKL